jgi:2-methylcitrate dehydratase PrpD
VTGQHVTHLTDSLIQFIVDDRLEEKARCHYGLATRALADAVAVMVAGAESPAARVARDALSGLGTGPAAVVGSPQRLPLLDAVLINAIAAHALDFDDTIQGLTTHPSCHLVPALLGLASQLDCTGPQLLTSYLVGLQVEHFIAAAVSPHHYRQGWHTTGTVGTIATAAAASRLLKLPAPQVRAALGAAVSAAAGLRANFGTMVKPLHAGHAARSGVESALLARAGLTATPDPLLHRFGFFAAAGGGAPPRAQIADLASFPVVGNLAFKPYPCCGEATGAVEAATALHRRTSIAPRTMAEIRIGPFAREILEFDVPRTPDEARFSITYCVAKALHSGGLSVADFSVAALEAAGVERFPALFSVLVDPTLGHERAAEVSISVAGQRIAERVIVPRGDPSVGFSGADVREKYLSCVLGEIDQDAAEQLLSDILALGSARHVGDLVARLA